MRSHAQCVFNNVLLVFGQCSAIDSRQPSKFAAARYPRSAAIFKYRLNRYSTFRLGLSGMKKTCEGSCVVPKDSASGGAIRRSGVLAFCFCPKRNVKRNSLLAVAARCTASDTGSRGGVLESGALPILGCARREI